MSVDPKPSGSSAGRAEEPEYLNARQAAAYLQVNQKKLYELAADGTVPATRATGKWLFPRRLLDEWLLESVRGGALTDRLIIGGSDDPLLAAAITLLAAEVRDEALVAYSPTGTRLGLELLARRRANVCGIHWGPVETSRRIHAQLLAGFPGNREWTLVRMASREQGLIVKPDLAGSGDLDALVEAGSPWAMRQEGAGSRHFLELALRERGIPIDRLRVAETAYSERHAAALVAQGVADCAPGVRSAAGEFALGFIPLGWEAFDLVVPKPVFFRSLFQRLLETLASERLRPVVSGLQGYDLTELGRIVLEGAERD